MGHHVVRMISLIISFVIISFICTHNLISHSSINGFKQHYTGNSRSFQKFHRALILERFRSLLGFKNFNNGKSRNEYISHFSSPSPSPSPGVWSSSAAPAPSPVVHYHRRAHPLSYHPLSSLLPFQKKKSTRTKRVLAAVLASLGITSALCAIGLCLVFRRRLKKQRRRPKRSVFSSSQSSGKKVGSEPVPGFFYIESIQTALEPEKSGPKLNSGSGKAYASSSSNEREEGSDKNLMKSEWGSTGWSSMEEITTVHEITESIKYEPESSSIGEGLNSPEDKIIREAEESPDSFDDESFHSFCDAHLSQSRLSNASATEILPEVASKEISDTKEESERHRSPYPPPPPPPPPPPSMRIPSPMSKPSARILSSLKKSSTLSNSSDESTYIPNPPPNAPSLKIPPPPPSHLTQQVPLGKDGSPLPKLKPLHWDKVRAAPDRSTVWDKLRSSSFEFDEEMIESLFGYNIQNTMKNEEVKSKTPSPGKHVLEPKRLHNITILSRALNATAEQVCGALIRGDGLSLHDLEALSKMEPTKEEETKLSNYKGDILELGSAEKLVQAVLQIPFAFQRIEAMLYRETFDDEVLHLKKSFSMLEEACKELRSSRLFLKLLEAVLKTGNRMNIGTIRGGAKAFKLDALLKLADVKGTDGKTTLLHFVVQEIIRSEGIRVSESIMGKISQRSMEDKEENYRRMGLDLLSGLSTELCNVKRTATVDLDVLASSVTNLSEGMSKLQHLVQKDMVFEGQKEKFVSSMRSFQRYAETKLKELQNDESSVLSHVREITEYFHGDVSKDESNPLRIFVIVRDFLSMLDSVCKELRSSKAPRSPNPLAPFR